MAIDRSIESASLVKPQRAHTADPPRVNTKARILQAAQEVFAERGFDGASTREIAARAEVNISSLHYHWDSKETLYRAIFAHIYERLVELVGGEVRRPESPERARAMIDRTMGLIFDAFADDPTVPKLLLRRLIEAPEEMDPGETVLGPAWRVFVDWAQTFAGDGTDATDAQEISFKLLTVQSALLVSMLDSPHVGTMLGGSLGDSTRRARLRRQMIGLVEGLMGVEASREAK